MSSNAFERLALNPLILRALHEEGYEQPTEIQYSAIPEVLAGNDLLATAQTGTGKTAAFALPMLHLLEAHRPKHAGRGSAIRALILTPTRELALQIDESFRTYGRHLSLRSSVVLGGVPLGGQIRDLKKAPDILVATPGRLLDLFDRRILRLDRVEILVLDEADRMLDMGFVKDVREITSKLPRERQTLFFSATLPRVIAELASDMLHSPSHCAVTPASSISDNIAQKVLFVERGDKLSLLTDILQRDSMVRTLVFTRTKQEADRVTRWLSQEGISAQAIHSNKNQRDRERALNGFHKGRTRVLVATDIVARGIDVEGISHVINYELPNDPESYVHRIGRTARAGATGIALSFCDFHEVAMLRAIEKLTRQNLTPIEDHPFHAPTISNIGTGESASRLSESRRRFGARGRRRGRRR